MIGYIVVYFRYLETTKYGVSINLKINVAYVALFKSIWCLSRFRNSIESLQFHINR